MQRHQLAGGGLEAITGCESVRLGSSSSAREPQRVGGQNIPESVSQTGPTHSTWCVHVPTHHMNCAACVSRTTRGERTAPCGHGTSISPRLTHVGAREGLHTGSLKG